MFSSVEKSHVMYHLLPQKRNILSKSLAVHLVIFVAIGVFYMRCSKLRKLEHLARCFNFMRILMNSPEDSGEDES
ncbi:unnamed protein product [Onchocerca flexuosa]|uniref:Ovule protein n=1 Tax=Onchocerca flexuosa TaxID=387005 RepID=A0A183H8Z8_9BILA|nr:unnamed protein product [Onchocerca flexuosa]